MISNLEKYKKDLENLIEVGQNLSYAMQHESLPKEFEKIYKPLLKEKYPDFIKKFPNFRNSYQLWYSEAFILLKQLLPDRIGDFVKLYEKPKTRKSIAYGDYVIEDYLQNIVITDAFGEVRVGPSAAIPQFEQQINIIKSIKKRFESSLFDIKQLVQADVFDSELDAAKELNKKGFTRGAGAVAGVVLEKHLRQVCLSHNVKINKKTPTISDFNDELKNSAVFETSTWRRIQHLGDLRNLCDHDKKNDPTKEECEDLIDGVERIIKTVF